MKKLAALLAALLIAAFSLTASILAESASPRRYSERNDAFFLIPEKKAFAADYPLPEPADTADFVGIRAEDEPARLKGFFEITDSFGVKNGEKLFSDYDAIKDSPSEWAAHANPCFEIEWEDADNAIAVSRFVIADADVVGALDLSYSSKCGYIYIGNTDITSIDLSGCPCVDFAQIVDNGSLQTLNAQNNERLSELYAGGNPALSSLGISGCAALEALDISGSLISSLSVDDRSSLYSLKAVNCSELTALSCERCALTELEIGGCPQLEELRCSDNDLTVLDLTGCPALISLYCAYNGILELDLSGHERLGSVYCGNNDMEELCVFECPELRLLDAACNSYTSLDLTGLSHLSYLHLSDCPYLTSLNCIGCGIIELSVQRCPALDDLYCRGNLISELDLEGDEALRILDAENDPLTQLDVSSCAALEVLNVNGTRITSLDLTGNSALRSVSAFAASSLTSLDLSGLSELTFVCAAECGLTTIDLRGSSAANLLITADGGGTVGFSANDSEGAKAYAYPSCAAAFSGWFDGSGESVSVSLELPLADCEGDTLTAVFRPITYTVSFMDGLTGETVAVLTVPMGGSVTPPTPPAHEGYVTSGWEIDGETPDFSCVTCDMTVTANYTREILPGDVNCDGTVGFDDAALLVRAILNRENLSEDALKNADVNGDGRINTADTSVLYKRLINLGW